MARALRVDEAINQDSFQRMEAYASHCCYDRGLGAASGSLRGGSWHARESTLSTSWRSRYSWEAFAAGFLGGAVGGLTIGTPLIGSTITRRVARPPLPQASWRTQEVVHLNVAI